jgi:hypothetical protein
VKFFEDQPGSKAAGVSPEMLSELEEADTDIDQHESLPIPASASVPSAPAPMDDDAAPTPSPPTAADHPQAASAPTIEDSYPTDAAVEESTAAGEASSRAEEVVGPSSIDMLL